MSKAKVKVRIIEILDNESKPITANDIYNLLKEEFPDEIDEGRTQEPLRDFIRVLIEEGNIIGSSRQGYFKIRTREQLNETILDLEGRSRGLHERIDNLKKAWNSQNPNNKIQ